MSGRFGSIFLGLIKAKKMQFLHFFFISLGALGLSEK